MKYKVTYYKFDGWLNSDKTRSRYSLTTEIFDKIEENDGYCRIYHRVPFTNYYNSDEISKKDIVEVVELRG